MPNRVLEPTPGDALDAPVQLLPGSAGVDLRDPQIWRDALTLYPVFDGFNDSAPLTPANLAAPTSAEFMTWHSAHQLEHLRMHGTVPLGTTLRYSDLPGGLLAMLSTDGTKVIKVNTLQYEDLARLPRADQEALASLQVFRDRFAQTQGLRPAGAETVVGVRAEMKAKVQDLRTTIQDNIPPLVAPATLATERDRFLADPSTRSELFYFLFTEQLDLFDLQLDNMGIFNPDRIDQEVKAFTERYARFLRYQNLPPETPPYDPDQPIPPGSPALAGGVNALDGGATIRTGRDVFLKVESQLYEVALATSYASATGRFLDAGNILANGFDSASGSYLNYQTIFSNADAQTQTNTTVNFVPSYGRVLDGPNMVFVLQNLQSVAREAEAEAKAEELNQSNRLLQDYTALQQMINKTLVLFQPAGDRDENAPPETKTLLGGVNTANLTTAEFPAGFRIASMFDQTASSLGGSGQHPIEQEKSIIRPVEIIAVGNLLNAQTKTVWDQFAITLGETTRILGQDSQIRMDEINKLNKAKNRAFDLGSNTLNKLTDILRSITT